MDIKTIIQSLEKEKEKTDKEASKYVAKKEDNFGLLEKMAAIDLAINELKKWQ